MWRMSNLSVCRRFPWPGVRAGNFCTFHPHCRVAAATYLEILCCFTAEKRADPAH